ncbi:MAG: transcriptional repressor [archaeon]
MKQKTRTTSQRIKIFKYLTSLKTHPNAEGVYNHVKKELPSITLATVYRNLNILAEIGEINRLEINNEYHYDAHRSSHEHAICKKCKKVFDLYDEKIAKIALKEFSSDLFDADYVKILFYGICKECKELGKSSLNE